jgi:uncharacterized phage protein (TIGR01671 family)
MNREIKFRIWDNDLKKFLNSSVRNLEFLKTYLEIIDQSDFGAASFFIQETALIPQQYTGLKDKNGKEIYEGDIVTYQQPFRASRLTHPATTDSYRTIKAPVIYNQDDFTYEIDRYALGTPMIKTRKDIEVVGNIFENPELLKTNE